jgi:hypothetical protein
VIEAASLKLTLKYCANRASAAFAAFAFIALLHAQPRTKPCQPTQPSPFSAVELSQFGAGSKNLEPDRPLHRRSHNIAFIDDKSLVLSFITPPEKPELTIRSGPGTYLLHTVVLDLNGRLLRSSTWATSLKRTVRLWVTKDSTILLQNGDALGLYSQQLEPLGIDRNIQAAAELQLGADGGSVLIVSPQQQAREVEVLESSNLKTKASWVEQRAPEWWSLWDNRLASRRDAAATEIRTRRLEDTTWQTVFSARGCFPGVPHLVGSERILFPSCKEILFLDLRGKTIAKEPLLKGERMYPRVSVATGVPVIGATLKDSQRKRARLLLYDLGKRQAVGSIPIDWASISYYDFAISPNGKMLALLQNNWVSIYKAEALGCR